MSACEQADTIATSCDQEQNGLGQSKVRQLDGNPESKRGSSANDNAPPTAAQSLARPEHAIRHLKQVLATEDLPAWLIVRIACAEMDPEFDHLDDE